MIIKSYITAADPHRAWLPLLSLSDSLRPRYFSSAEDLTKIAGAIDETTAFDRFVDANRFGYFLFANRARYNITVRKNQSYFTLAVDPVAESLNEADVLAILDVLTHVDLVFALAGEIAEYRHRNKYSRKLGANNVEAWVGRDVSKYLPGIYWRTVVSDKHEEILNQSPSLNFTGSEVVGLGSNHLSIRAFKNSTAWEQYAPLLDNWCAEHLGVFSLKRIQGQLDEAKDVLSLSSLLAQWR